MPRNLRAGNKSPTLFLNEPLCMDDLLPANIIFIEMPDEEALKSYNGAYDRGFFWGGEPDPSKHYDAHALEGSRLKKFVHPWIIDLFI